MGTYYVPTCKCTAAVNVTYGSKKLSVVYFSYITGHPGTKNDALRLATSFFKGVDHPFKSPAKALLLMKSLKTSIYWSFMTHKTGIISTWLKLLHIKKNIKASMQKLNSKRAGCDEETIRSMSDFVAPSIQCLDQKESLRVSEVERFNETKKKRCAAAEL